MKKRIIAILLVISVLFTCACGSDTDEDTSNEQVTQAQTTLTPSDNAAGKEIAGAQNDPAGSAAADTSPSDTTDGLQQIGVIFPNEDKSAEYPAVTYNGLTYMLLPDNTAVSTYTAFSDDTVTECTVPETFRVEGVDYTVTELGTESFYFFESLEKVSIPGTVKKIGDSAFYGCSSLKSIDIPEGVTDILNDAFCECEALESISFPDSVKTIGNGALYGCVSLKSVKLPSGLTVIPEELLCNCDALESVDIPSSVTTIADDAFWFCEQLKSLTLPESLTTIGAHAFYDCMSLKELVVPNSVTSIGEGAFLFCDSMELLKVPEALLDSISAEYATETFTVESDSE